MAKTPQYPATRTGPTITLLRARTGAGRSDVRIAARPDNLRLADSQLDVSDVESGAAAAPLINTSVKSAAPPHRALSTYAQWSPPGGSRNHPCWVDRLG